MNFRFTLLCLAATVIGLVAQPADAVTIRCTRVAVGTKLQGITTVAPTSSNMRGGNGTLASSAEITACFNQAATIWQSIFQSDNVTLDIKWGFSPQPSTYGMAGDFKISGTTHRTISASVLIDSIDPLYIDRTPTSSSEFPSIHMTTYNEGAGQITDQYWRDGASGDAGSLKDMMSVALHEIGHCLGMNAWQLDASNGGSDVVTVTSPRPFPGTWAQLDYSSGHIADGRNFTLMQGGTGGSTLACRVFPSTYDILTLAQLMNTTPNSSWIKTTPVPEPAAYAMLACGLVLLPLVRKSRKG